jgi:hypothetical protein
MIRGLIQTMSVNSIVEDYRYDALIETAARTPSLAHEGLARLAADTVGS